MPTKLEQNLKNIFNINLSSIKFFIVCLLIVCGFIIIYNNHWQNTYHLDDFHTITDNPHIRTLKNWKTFFTDGTTSSILPSNQSYRPIVTLSLAIDFYFAQGYNVFYFHLSTFIWMFIQGLLLFLLIVKLIPPSVDDQSRKYLALFVVALFSYHTVISETVNYIIARSDLISTVFVIMALLMYVSNGFWRKFYLYLIPFTLSILTKAPGVMFAPVLFFYVLLFEEKKSLTFSVNSFKISLIKCLPTFVIAIGGYILTVIMTPETYITGGADRLLYFLTQPFVILHYFISFFVPYNLSIDTDFQLVKGVGDIKVLVGLIFNILLIYFAFKQSKKENGRIIAFGIVWFYLALIPSSSIIPLSEVLNDHRMYFPFVGLTWAVVIFVYQQIVGVEKGKLTLPMKRTLLIGAGIILAVAGYGTHQRNEVWKTEESIWLDCTKKSPKNGRGLMNYGVIKMGQGDYQSAERYFTRALRYTPYYSTLYINLAIVKNVLGYPAVAEENFKLAIQYGADNPNAYFYYGDFLRRKGNMNEAISNLNKGAMIAPNDLRILQSLVEAYNSIGNDSKVKEVAQQILTLDATNAVGLKYINGRIFDPIANTIFQIGGTKESPEYFLELSLQYYNQGDFKKCIESAKKALKLNPNYAPAYNNICAAYNNLQNWDLAVEAGLKAVQIDPTNQLAKNNLAFSLSQQKKK